MGDTAERILLSFDAEEFDIPREFGHAISEDEQMRIGREGVQRVLDVLDEVGCRATFFSTARIVLHAPDLFRRAVNAGHEIASHGYAHSTFENADLQRSREAILSVLPSGTNVIGFRRPRMAPTDPGEVLRAGYTYHSSENPIWLPGRYNKFFSPRRWSFEEGSGVAAAGAEAGTLRLLKIPAAATPLIRWPLFWLSFKNTPRVWTQAMTAWCLRTDGYAALYFHPWELCELNAMGGFGLPRYVRRIDGDALTDRLRRYLRWCTARGEVCTYADFAEGVRRANAERARV